MREISSRVACPACGLVRESADDPFPGHKPGCEYLALKRKEAARQTARALASLDAKSPQHMSDHGLE